ncbi:MAG: hypothetical protein CSA62_02925 [Planctomycetota bacterium]|nr:MAG: hypothetical protein CSA62_02925 [Planctomycetota bacterium]
MLPELFVPQGRGARPIFAAQLAPWHDEERQQDEPETGGEQPPPPCLREINAGMTSKEGVADGTLPPCADPNGPLAPTAPKAPEQEAQ